MHLGSTMHCTRTIKTSRSRSREDLGKAVTAACMAGRGGQRRTGGGGRWSGGQRCGGNRNVAAAVMVAVLSYAINKLLFKLSHVYSLIGRVSRMSEYE